jgi:hypothetical protein
VAENSQDILIKVSAQEAQCLSSLHIGEEWDNIDPDKDFLRTNTESIDFVDELHWVLNVVRRISRVSSKQAGHTLGQAVGGVPDSANDQPKGNSSLWIFGSPDSLCVLDPCGRSCWTTISETDDHMRRSVIFGYMASLWPLVNSYK